MKKYQRRNIGEIHISNEGCEIEVIDGGSESHFCTIKIGKYVGEVYYGNLEKGKVKNPYHPSVHGVGYLGEGRHTVRIDGVITEIYKVWVSMLQRCYDSELQVRCKTYKDVTVCKEWHNFQNFAEWAEGRHIEGYHLDKDLLKGDDKVYAPKTCIFLPQGLNKFLTNIRTNNTSGVIGVSWEKSRNRWKAQISIDGVGVSLGRFNTQDEASRAYKKARKKQAKVWQKRMTGILSKKAIKGIK